MLPDLESLHCFEVAARHANFRRAAREVHLSPAAFGDRIRRLEDQLGTPLFDRTTRKVELTIAGERVLAQARRTLEEAARCFDVARDPTAPRTIEMTVGTRFELGLSWIAPALSELARARPERRIHLYFGDSVDLFERTRVGAIDAMVTSARLTQAGFDYAPLHEERYVFVGAAKKLAKEPIKRAADARTHALIDTAPDLPLFRYFLDAASPKAIWSFGSISYLGTIAAVRLRVVEGAGVAVLPRYFVEGDLEAGRLVEVMPSVEPNRDFFRLFWRAEHPDAEQLHALADELRRIPLR